MTAPLSEPPEVARLIDDPVGPGVAGLLTTKAVCARRISKSASPEGFDQ